MIKSFQDYKSQSVLRTSPSKNVYLYTHGDGWDVQVSVSNGRQRGFRSRGPVFCERTLHYTYVCSSDEFFLSKLE